MRNPVRGEPRTGVSPMPGAGPASQNPPMARLPHTLLRCLPGGALALAAALAFAEAPPPVPPIQSVAEMGPVKQNHLVTCRDATYSALIEGRSVWTFGDTCLRKGGVAQDQ